MATAPPSGSVETTVGAGVAEAPALVLSAITRSFACRRVLGPVDLHVDAGAVCVVSGPNGAGKTTLLRVAAGLLAPTTGTTCRAGSTMYLRSGSGLRAAQTVDRAVGYVARLTAGHGVAPGDALSAVGLAGLGKERAGALSAGQRARASLALALVAAPAVLCLDEPGAHLDLAGQGLLAEVVRMIAGRGAAVMVATHDPVRLSAVADGELALRDGLVRRERVR